MCNIILFYQILWFVTSSLCMLRMLNEIGCVILCEIVCFALVRNLLVRNYIENLAFCILLHISNYINFNCMINIELLIYAHCLIIV